jgi:hypothetical protein
MASFVQDFGDSIRRMLVAAKQRAGSFLPFGRKSAVNDNLKDIARLLKKFDPRKAGRDAAASGDEPGKFEFSAVIAFQEELDRQAELAGNKLKNLDVDVNLRLPSKPEISSDQIMATVDMEQESAWGDWEEPLVNAKSAVLGAKRGLNAFRSENPPVLLRPAFHRNRIVAWVSIGAVWAFELVMNYIMLLSAGGHDLSELVTWVGMTATINLALGLLGIGLIGVRYLGHVKTKRKLFGGSVLALSLCCILLLHFVLAHYRNALDTVKAASVDAPAAVTKQSIALIPAKLGGTMRSEPLVFLGDPNAILVFLMGIGFAAAAACEGYWLLTDPYPGYAAADRIYQRTLKTFNDQRDGFEQDMAATITKAYAALDAAVFEGTQRLNAVKAGLDSAIEITRQYEQVGTKIEHAMLRIIDVYRAEYRNIRENAGPPQWEDDEPRLNRSASFGLEGFAQIQENEVTNYNALKRQAGDIRVQVTNSHTELKKRIREYIGIVDQNAKHQEDIARAGLNGVHTPPPPSVGEDREHDAARGASL